MKSIEFILQPGETVRFDVEEVLFQEKSEFQLIEIVRTKTFGKSIFLDKKPQSSEIDHFIFNEILVHPALIMQERPSSVLMIGGGPGSGLAEIVKYSSVKEIVICDIDRVAVNAYRRLCPEWHCNSFDDSRVKLLHLDARKYLEQSDKKFDVIYLDIPDPLEAAPSIPLFSLDFYKILKSRINAGGIIISQAGRTAINNLVYHAGVRRGFESIFSQVASFDRHIPFYAEAWGFVFASDEINPLALSAVEIDSRLKLRGITDLKCYSGSVHHGMFAQPPYFFESMRKLGKTYTDTDRLQVL